MALREPKVALEPDTRSILAPIVELAKHKETFRRSLLTVTINAFSNLRTFPEICRLIKTGPFADALRMNPRFILRCLTPNYLVRGSSVGVGARCFLYHHRRLNVSISGELLRRLTLGEVTLYESTDEKTRVSVTIGQTMPPHDKEGELDISLQVDGRPVFLLSFTIVPGWAGGSDSSEIILISRIQGILGCYPEIKRARRVMADVAPNALLFAALQGIAMALGVRQFACVSSTQQCVYREDIAERLRRAYEEFFAELGVGQNSAGFLMSAIPLLEKPLSSIKTGHKLRTKEKRAMKTAVKRACLDTFRPHIVRAHVAGVTLIRQRDGVRSAAETEAASRAHGFPKKLPLPLGTYKRTFFGATQR